VKTYFSCAFPSSLVTGAGAQWYPPSPAPNVTVVYPPQPPPVVVQSPPEVVIMHAQPVEEYVPPSGVKYLIAFKNSLVRYPRSLVFGGLQSAFNRRGTEQWCWRARNGA
jgi:hypothetical protein